MNRARDQVRLNASSHWRRESSMPQVERFHCLIIATSDHSLCNQPLPAQQSMSLSSTQGSGKSRTIEGFSFITDAAVEWLLLPRNFCQPGSITTRAEQNNFTAGSREGLTTSITRKHLIDLLSTTEGQQYNYCDESSSFSWRTSWKSCGKLTLLERIKSALFSNWSFVQIVHGVGG